MVEPNKQTVQGEEPEEIQEKKLEYDELVVTRNADGKVVFTDDYCDTTLGEKIGAGAFCKVIKATGHYKESGEVVPYALKRYSHQMLKQMVPNGQASSQSDAGAHLQMRSLRKQVEDEVTIWGKFSHDNVCKAFALMEEFKVTEDPHPYMYLMMQLADLGEIASWDQATCKYVANARLIDFLTKKLTEEEEFKQFGVDDCANMHERIAKFVFQQVANGLEYLHEEAFVANRDLKPDNILFTTKEGGTNIFSHDRAQITDFTTVFQMEKDTADVVEVSIFQGTKSFQAPEVSLRSQYKPRPLDVWALGVTMYAFLFGELPFFNAADFNEIESLIQTQEVQLDDKDISDGLKEVIRAFLTKDPDQRPSIREAKARFTWLQRPDFPSERPPID